MKEKSALREDTTSTHQLTKGEEGPQTSLF